mmetsp:Transcript_7961/g.16721  ORF Transcript_7961/g.16721 Transcript_7961/m.16721 type:complete len:650 (+) Transcript_7961:1231-3180(+)
MVMKSTKQQQQQQQQQQQSTGSSGSNTSSSSFSKDTQILVNGQRGQIPKRLVGVVWQDDLLLSNLTVFENVWYAARLKTPQSVADDIVRNNVLETLRQLDLSRVQHSIVGNALLRRGVSGGERKRVAVASELVLRPSLLFLDEPTSGLDATTALGLMQTLKHLAVTQGHSIVTVIHQPRTTIFNTCIDSLLLLSRGRAVYNGPPQQVRQYLESLTVIDPLLEKNRDARNDNAVDDGYRGESAVAPLPPETGIADWIMDVIKEDEQKCTQPQTVIDQQHGGDGVVDDTTAMLSLGDYWQRHQRQTKLGDIATEEGEIVGSVLTSSATEHSPPQDAKLSRRMSTLEELTAMPKFNTSFGMQFKLLTQRTLKQQRGDRLTATALALQFVYLFFTGLFWWRMPNNTDYLYQRNSLFFFMLIAQSNGVVTMAVNVFAMERTLLKRERAKKMYRVLSYFLAKTVSDMTNNVLLPVLYTMIVYWMANLRPTVTAYCKFSLTYYLIFSTAQSMGLAISIAIPKFQLALVLAPPLTLFFMIMGGFYIPLDNMHPGIQWATWLSFCRYGYSALLINEYQGRDIPCGDDSGTAQDNLSSLLSNQSNDLPTNCPLAGEDVLDAMGIRGSAVENFWFNILMLVILQLVLRVAAYWMLRRSKN